MTRFVLFALLFIAGDALGGVAPFVREQTTAAITAVENALQGRVPAAELPPPSACRAEAAPLIVRWEVTSEAHYNRRLRFPIWPRGASGVTWGVGDDGGHKTARAIRDDWREHNYVERLSTTAGIIGERARVALPRYRNIPTEFQYAYFVFQNRTLVEYERRARRAFGAGFDLLPPNVCGALVSLVYNRGASMVGDSRREFVVIRDDCIPDQNYACIAAQIRSMKRLWRGTVNENGLSARREDEARLVERN